MSYKAKDNSIQHISGITQKDDEKIVVMSTKGELFYKDFIECIF